MKPLHAVLVSVVLAAALCGLLVFVGSRIESRCDRVESRLKAVESRLDARGVWEYRVVFLKDLGIVQPNSDPKALHYDFLLFQSKLNEFGAEGWELADLYLGEFETTRFVTLKRRVTDPIK